MIFPWNRQVDYTVQTGGIKGIEINMYYSAHLLTYLFYKPPVFILIPTQLHYFVFRPVFILTFIRVERNGRSGALSALDYAPESIRSIAVML